MLQFIVTQNYNIWNVIERLFKVRLWCSSFWHRATTFEKSYRGYSRPNYVTVYYDTQPQHLSSHREVVSGGSMLLKTCAAAAALRFQGLRALRIEQTIDAGGRCWRLPVAGISRCMLQQCQGSAQTVWGHLDKPCCTKVVWWCWVGMVVVWLYWGGVVAMLRCYGGAETMLQFILRQTQHLKSHKEVIPSHTML